MKYVFWEVVGQLTNVESSLMALIEARLKDSVWASAIINTVIWGHPYFVTHFIENGLIPAWLQTTNFDTALQLLQSVNTELGDQIVELLRPYAFQNKDRDAKIFRTLCWKPKDDTDEMFDFRLSLLIHNPELFDVYINFVEISKANTLRSARLLECYFFFDESAAKKNSGELIHSKFNIFEYLGKEIPEYIWDIFLPVIEERTAGEISFWSPRMSGWSEFGITPSVGRGVVHMAIVAGKYLAEAQPNRFYCYFLRYANSDSIIINEILLYTLLHMPESYADGIIEWLKSNSCSHMTEETGVHKKKLEATRFLLEKYSRLCSDMVFMQLEKALYYYHDEYELENARERFEYNKKVRNRDFPSSDCVEAYWPYWGKTQAYLLPALSADRTSQNTKQLIPVLQRRFYRFELGGTKSGISTSWGGLSSPIPNDVSYRFSDPQWLAIIRNKKILCNEYLAYRNNSELSHETLARQYEHIGLRNPERYVALAMQFPPDVDRHYIQAVWNIASSKEAPKETENWKPAEFETIRNVTEWFLHHHDADEYNMCCSFCDYVAPDYPSASQKTDMTDA